MKKLTIIKDSNKIKWGNREIQSKCLVRGILGVDNLKSKIHKKRRTYWVWVTLNQRATIYLGDYKVTRGDDKKKDGWGHTIYHQLEEQGCHPVIQFVSTKLNQKQFKRSQTLIKNEQLLVVFTEIQNNQIDRRARMKELIDDMKYLLEDYQVRVFSEYEKQELPVQLVQVRLGQVDRLLRELDEMVGRSRDCYKKAQSGDIYMKWEI